MKPHHLVISSCLIAIFSLLSVNSLANPIIPPHLASVEKKGESCNVEIQFYTARKHSSYYLFGSQTLENEHVPTLPENLILNPPPKSGYSHRMIHCHAHGGMQYYYELFQENGGQMLPVEDFWDSRPSFHSIFLNEDCQPDLSVCDIPCDSSSCKLSVELRDFRVGLEANQIHFQWETATEEDSLGINIWCAQMEDNHFKELIKLNPKLIPTQGHSRHGARYSKTYSVETVGLKAGMHYCALEEVDSEGQCALHCDHIDAMVLGQSHSAPDYDKATALCDQYKQEGMCLE